MSVVLSESDIPGSFLNGRNPSELKNDELRFWLKCRDDSVKGLRKKPNSSSSKLVFFDRCIHLTRKPRVSPMASFAHEGFRPDLYSFRPDLDLCKSLIRLEVVPTRIDSAF